MLGAYHQHLLVGRLVHPLEEIGEHPLEVRSVHPLEVAWQHPLEMISQHPLEVAFHEFPGTTLPYHPYQLNPSPYHLGMLVRP
jgi:hypothetical protein